MTKSEWREKLAQFGETVLAGHMADEGELSRESIFELAVEAGVLVVTTVAEPCGEDCMCASESASPYECIRYPDVNDEP